MKQLFEKEVSVLTVGTEILTKDLMDQHLRTLGEVSTYYGSKLSFALDTFKKQKIDIIFCELNFSDGSIQQFIKGIGGLHYGSDLYVIVANRDRSPELAALRADLGIDEILVRPFTADNVREIMERAQKKISAPKPSWSVELKVAFEAEKNKRFAEADKFFMRVFQNNPQALEAMLEVAKFWIGKGRYDESEKLAEDLLVNFPEDTRVLDVLGRVHSRKGSYRRAVSLLEQAQIQSPLNSERALELADAYLLLANELARKVIRLDEFDSEAQTLNLKISALRRQYGAVVTQYDIKQNYFVGENAKEASAFLALAKNLGKLK
jgi:tetratricopeptide (TPR) repeat protein